MTEKKKRAWLDLFQPSKTSGGCCSFNIEELPDGALDEGTAPEADSTPTAPGDSEEPAEGV